ncbi:MAG: hypothetical protein J6C46_01190 [Clostridia bacterium]|nr:hypothetical protein [Clostridia bacterium]
MEEKSFKIKYETNSLDEAIKTTEKVAKKLQKNNKRLTEIVIKFTTDDGKTHVKKIKVEKD